VPRSPHRLAVAIGLASAEAAAAIIQTCREQIGTAVIIPAGNANDTTRTDCVREAMLAACPNHTDTILGFTALPSTLHQAAAFTLAHNIATLVIESTRPSAAAAIAAHTQYGIIARTRHVDGSTDHAVYLSPIHPPARFRTLRDAQANTTMLATPHNLALAGISGFTEAAVVVPF
jgi:hypothetical protein